MGYESKLYVVKKGSFVDDDGKQWCDVVAMIDLSKCYPLADRFRGMPKTDCYFYGGNGNKKITKDMYGEPLKEASISQAVEFAEETIAAGVEYHRLDIALALLKAAQEANKDYVVLHSGY